MVEVEREEEKKVDEVEEEREARPHFIEEEEFMDESKFCKNCMKRQGRMEELNGEISKMYKEVDDLRGLISGLKTEQKEFGKEKEQWTINLEASKSRYEQTLSNKTKIYKEYTKIKIHKAN